MPKALDLTKQTKGRLTALYPTEKRDSSGRVIWIFQCKCGNKPEISSSHFSSGNTRSCGCLQKEIVGHMSKIHGMSNTPTYKTWSSMIQRCTNPKNPGFKYWGGRDITVCERWHTFENFFADMGLRPEGKSLDRWPNNDGNYESGNCRWATRKEQATNSRSASCGPAMQRRFRAWHKDSLVKFISNNQHEFARKWNLNLGNVSACLTRKRRTCEGWSFEYLPT